MDASPSVIRRMRWGAELVLHFSGVTSLYARSRSAGAVILMYHSVTPPELTPFVDPRVRISPARFAKQMNLVASSRRALGMSELTRRRNRSDIPHGSVVITIDDGYLDTLTTAAPILARLNLPAIVYLPTEYISNSEPQWVDRLYTALHHRRRNLLVLPDGNRVDVSRAMSSVRAVYEPMLAVMNMEQRREVLSDLEQQLLPSLTPPRLTMTWDDVRTLQRRYPQIELGMHTAEHADLTALPRHTVEADLEKAQETAVRELGRPLRHFSFPYSRDDAATRALVKQLGYESAVGAGERYFIGEHSDLHALSRIEPGDNIALLRFWTSGAYPDLSRAIWGRA